MSRKMIALFAIFAVLAVFSVVKAGDMMKEGMGSWTGEVIDIACHSMKGAMGAGHMECGKTCVKAGLPVGLLVDGTTYILVWADHKPANEKFADHVSHMVTVTGTKYESAGANVIEVKDFKMAEMMK